MKRTYLTLCLQPSAKMLGFSFLLKLILTSPPPQMFVNHYNFWGQTNSRPEGFPLTKKWHMRSLWHQKGVDSRTISNQCAYIFFLEMVWLQADASHRKQLVLRWIWHNGAKATNSVNAKLKLTCKKKQLKKPLCATQSHCRVRTPLHKCMKASESPPDLGARRRLCATLDPNWVWASPPPRQRDLGGVLKR